MLKIVVSMAALMIAAAPGVAGDTRGAKSVDALSAKSVDALSAISVDARSAQSIAPPRRIPSPPRTDTIPGTPVAASEIPREVRHAVVADAAQRFRVDTNSVVLAQAERVTWPDGALGCPEPGMSYAQAQVPGFRVAAKTLAGALLYHTDSQGRALICSR